MKKLYFMILLAVLLPSSLATAQGVALNQWTTDGQDQVLVFVMPYDFNVEKSWTVADSYATAQWVGATQAALLIRSSANDRKFTPDLADGMPTQHNNTYFTLTLKQGLLFETGNPLTADDVVFSYQVALNPSINLNSYGFLSSYMDNDSIVAVDDYTIDFHLTSQYAFVNGLFSFGIIDQDLFVSDYDACNAGDATACDWNDLFYAGGQSGPFKFESMDETNQVVTVVKNYNYWNAGNVWAHKIIFKKILEKAAAISELAAGTADILDAQYKPLPNELKNVAGITERYVGDPAHAEMSVNHQNPYFGTGTAVPDTGDVTDNAEQARLIRKAISHIVDRQFIAEEIEAGLSQPASTAMPSASLGWRSDLAYDAYNITFAKELMTSVGFDYASLTWDDVNEEYSDGFFDVVVMAPNSNPLRNQWSELIANTLPKIGIHVTDYLNIPWADIIPRTFGYVPGVGEEWVPDHASGGFDIMFVNYSWGLDWNPTSLYDSKGLVKGGDGSNYYNFVNQTIEDQVTAYASELNVETRIQLVGDLQTMLNYELPIIPLTYPQSHWGWQGDIVGIDDLLISVSGQEWGNVRSYLWEAPAGIDPNAGSTQTVINTQTNVSTVVSTQVSTEVSTDVSTVVSTDVSTVESTVEKTEVSTVTVEGAPVSWTWAIAFVAVPVVRYARKK